ncbi:MAG: TlpA family protein disulfide reductase [Planctomycetes bacterium]|nr:TlpA family protein disulfide reductase [Planctomycetota bacterium]
MAKSRIGFKTLAIALLFSGAGITHAANAPTAAQMLQFKPRQPGIAVATPADAELANFKVELAKGQKLANGKTASGWILKDGLGRVSRRFFDTDGDNQIDVWSYYTNGEEVYREIDSNLNGKVDQYRWLGTNGSKWGVDLNEDGKVDTWKVISPEELSQEVLAATLTRDYSRLQALMVTKTDLDTLDLPESEANRIKTKLQGAATAFQTASAALAKLSEKTRWVHLETSSPECVPADAIGAKADLLRHRHGTILYSDDKTNDFLQTGELILVGKAWRIIEGPVSGGVAQNTTSTNPGGGTGIEITDAIKTLVEDLKPIDEKYKTASTPAAVVEYNLARVVVLEKIVTATKGKNREEWLKQVADCYSTAAQNGEEAVLPKLTQWKVLITKEEPGSNVAAYVAYREMSAEYALRLAKIKPEQMTKMQDEWKDRLAKFVQDYPTAEDTPDALMQLGMVNEFIGKETEAKNWYTHLVRHFEKNPMAPKAAGAIRRLALEGQEFELVSQTLGSKNAFDIKSVKGKIALVYYWASWNTQCVGDFAKIKSVIAGHGAKVELVCVNLDNDQEAAIKFLQNTPVPGAHLFQPGGLDSPPAVQYGIMVLPNMFIVGADGKVVSRNAQVATLEDDLKKLLK